MRLKLYIPELGKVINIDKIEPKSGKNPGIFFRCHKKYEWTIFGSKVIFIDKNYKEYFTTNKKDTSALNVINSILSTISTGISLYCSFRSLS